MRRFFVTPESAIRRPVLASHARYRWDTVRCEHQIVYAEGVLVLNETAAVIVQQCDGQSMENLILAVQGRFEGDVVVDDVHVFLRRLSEKGLLHDAAVP